MSDNPVGHLNAKNIKVKISPVNEQKESEGGDFLETDYR